MTFKLIREENVVNCEIFFISAVVGQYIQKRV